MGVREGESATGGASTAPDFCRSVYVREQKHIQGTAQGWGRVTFPYDPLPRSLITSYSLINFVSSCLTMDTTEVSTRSLDMSLVTVAAQSQIQSHALFV